MEVMTHSSTFLLPSNHHSSSVTYALVVLNRPLPRFTPLLWNHAQVRVCADGGANRVFDEMPLLFPSDDALDVRQSFLGKNTYSCAMICLLKCLRGLLRPNSKFYIGLARQFMKAAVRADKSEHLIPTSSFNQVQAGHNQRRHGLSSDRSTGLLYQPGNSVSLPHLYHSSIIRMFSFYSSEGTRVVDESHDQDTTDLHKCVAYIRDLTPNLDKSNLCILVAGALGGRFDHEAGNMNVLYRFSTMRLILLSDDCLIYLLPSTHLHEIYIQSSVEGPHCGLIPIGMPSGSTTTTGLQWDLNNTEMRFGDVVSTSNLVRGEKITVQSSSDLLWTISIKV
ncbi:thiamine pyrophosphokinase 1 isoform X1 [Populus alba x Populus x berolinensis]|nr:thiamine pyrophosphokinase 1 isoform X1 [Populus alba x Populus x berolinensis]